MHHLSPVPRREGTVTYRSPGCQDLVRFFALLRIKPHAPPLVRVPVNSFEFHSCERTPQVEYLLRWLRTEELCSPTPSIHRLRRGLPGYLILFAPHAFEPQRQLPSSKPPSPLVFLLISTHFTRYTRNSAYLSGTQDGQFPMQSRGWAPAFHIRLVPSVYAPFTPSKSG